MDFLHGDWNVVRHISDHLTGAVGVFRGQASFSRAGLVLTYREHGELRFGGHSRACQSQPAVPGAG